MQNPQGQADGNGVREFVVGTGGASHYDFDTPEPNSEVRNGDTFGVLKLTLHADSYEFEFAPVAGQTFTDGPATTKCHNGAAAGDTTPPAAPTDVATTAGDGHVALDWTDNSEADLAGYRVYRDGSKIASPTTSSYDDTGLTNGTGYSYQLTAVDESGNESAKSEPVTATPEPAGSSQYSIRGIYDRDLSSTGFGDLKSLGFNYIDSGPGDDFGALAAANLKGFVWLGGYDNSSCQFNDSDATVSSQVSNLVDAAGVGAYFIGDEPDPFACPTAYAQFKARSELVKSIDPAKPTLIVVDSNSGQQTLQQIPEWKGTADVIGLDAYPCYPDLPCDYQWIDTVAQTADDAGLDYWGVVQSFGDASEGFRLPTPDELHQQFIHWRATKMKGYLVFAWRWPRDQSSLWLANHPELQSQLAVENGG